MTPTPWGLDSNPLGVGVWIILGWSVCGNFRVTPTHTGLDFSFLLTVDFQSTPTRWGLEFWATPTRILVIFGFGLYQVGVLQPPQKRPMNTPMLGEYNV